MKKIAAIIPAAGFSSRMGLFKPLLPLSGTSLVIEMAINTFCTAGIGEILVVIGYKADLLVPLLERLGVKPVWHESYRRGMYSSIQAGVQALSSDVEAFFLLPADYPFVSAETVRHLVAAAGKIRRNIDVIYPVFQRKRGHPPLLSKRLIPMISEGQYAGGLRELLQARRSLDLPVDDAGILRDLDTEEDYQKALPPELPLYPDSRTCEQILAKRNTPAHLLRHVQRVAAVGETISEHLNSRGLYIHTGLVKAACLLHDIAKGERNHPEQGRQIAAALGYPAVAEIIACHMKLPAEYAQGINEYSLVYLADKMVHGDRIVSLEARREAMLSAYPDDPAARQSIDQLMTTAMRIRDRVKKITGLTWEKLA